MKYLLTLSIVLSVFVTGAQTQAQSQTPPAEPAGWTLEQCMLYAVENSPETNIQKSQNDIYRQNYKEAIGRLLPSLGASVGASFNFGRNLGNDNTYSDANSFNNNYSASTGLTLFDGLRNVNNIRLQKINRLMGRQQLEMKRDNVAYATMEAYFNVLYYKELVALAAEQLAESSRNLLQTERMMELGAKGFPDVAEMRAQEAASRYRLTAQQNRLAIGVILLKEQMNFPVDEQLDVAGYDPAAPVVKSTSTAADIFDAALGYLPRAQVAESSLKHSTIAYRYAKGGLLPTISVNGGYSTNFFRNLDGSDYLSFGEQFTGKRGFYVGASLNIPIFNGFSTSANIRRSRSQLQIARIDHDSSLRTLYSEIEQAVADMNGQADQYIQAGKQTEATSVAHDVNRRKYEEGMLSALELHTSSNRLLEARATELNSFLTYILKKRMVDYYSGVPLLNLENHEN